MPGKTKKSTTKKKKINSGAATMKKCASAWNNSSKRGKYTDFVKSFFKKNK